MKETTPRNSLIKGVSRRDVLTAAGATLLGLAPGVRLVDLAMAGSDKDRTDRQGSGCKRSG